MDVIVCNLNGKPRRAMLNGREHVVVPASMIVPGVLPGSRGPGLYTAEETARNVADWNGMPITNGHPTNAVGEFVSARTPAIADVYELGRVYEAKHDGRLTAEAWLDVAVTNRRVPGLIADVEAGKKIELSTGIFNLVPVPAPAGSVHNAGDGAVIPYDWIATDIKPDHLAVFANGKTTGACSLKDGCGINVNANVNAATTDVDDLSVSASDESAIDAALAAFDLVGNYWSDAARAAASAARKASSVANRGTLKVAQAKALGHTGAKLAEKATKLHADAKAAHEHAAAELVKSARVANKLGSKEETSAFSKHQRAMQLHEAMSAHHRVNNVDARAEDGTRRDMVANFASMGCVSDGQMSHDAVRSSLYAAMRGQFKQDEPSPYIHDVFPDHVVYEHSGDLHRQDYTTSADGSVSLTGKPTKVQRQTTYVPVGNAASSASVPQGDATMTRNETITWLVSNCDCWKGREKVLANADAFPDAELAKLKVATETAKANATLVANAAQAAGPGGAGAAAAAGSTAGAVGTTTSTVTPPPVATPVTNENRLSAAEREDLAFAREERMRQKHALVHRLTANVADTAAREAHARKLFAKPIDELRELIDLMAPAGGTVTNSGDTFNPAVFNALTANGGVVPSYFGAAGGPMTTNAGPAKDDRNNVLPTYDLDWDSLASPALRTAKV